MDFQTAVRTCLQVKYADFNGRAARPEFWWFFLFTWLVGRIAAALDGAVGWTGHASSSMFWYSSNFTLFNTVTSVALFLPSLAVGVRRLRDAGKSPWNLLWSFLPIIGWIVLIVQLTRPTASSATEF